MHSSMTLSLSGNLLGSFTASHAFLLCMAQSVVLINKIDIIPPNLCLACSYIFCYSRICEVLDLIIVGHLVLLSLANTQRTWSPVP